MKVQNLFAASSDHSDQERFETLLQTNGFRLELIISTGQATPPGQWYDQDRSEWVMLVSGSAGLIFEGETAVLALRPGDHLLIPARRKHRVEWTSPDEPTVWLALHFD